MRSSSRARPPRAGFTVAELLVVISIIALLGALSVGAFRAARRNYGLQSAASEVASVLRAARNTAIVAGTPSVVVVDPIGRSVRAWRYETLGEWSFEPSPPEADGEALPVALRESDELVGAREVPGRVGAGVAFSTGAYLDAGALARFDVEESLAIEAWILHGFVTPVRPPRREADAPRFGAKSPATVGAQRTAMSVVEKEGAYALGLTEEGALEAAIGEFRMRTRDGVVAPDRWVHVSLRFAPGSLVVAADGVERELVPVRPGVTVDGVPPTASLPVRIPRTSSPLRLSSPDPRRSLRAAVDEVRLRGQVEPLVHDVPEFQLLVGWKKIIHFDRYGRLDPAHHVEGVRIALLEAEDLDAFATGRTTSVDYSQTFAEWAAATRAAHRLGAASVSEPRQADLERQMEENLLARPGVQGRAIEVDRLGVVR